MGSAQSSPAPAGRAEIALRGIDSGRDPLFIAIRRNDTAAVMALIETEVAFVKANSDAPNLLTEPDWCQRGPLHLALSMDKVNVEIVKALLKAMIDIGADLNHRDSDLNTVLHLLLRKNLEQIAIELISEMAARESNLNVLNHLDMTPLHFAASGGLERATQALINAGADINSQSEEGFTPLHATALLNQIEITKILLEAKADVDLQNCRHETALHIAIRFGYADIVCALLVAGAKIDLPDDQGRTAISLAQQSNNENIRNMLTAIHSFSEQEYQQAVDAAILIENAGYYNLLWEMAERIYQYALARNNQELFDIALWAYENISPDDTLHYVDANSRIAHMYFDQFVALESEAEEKQDADFIMSDSTKLLLKKILHHALLARPDTQGIIDQVCRRLSGLGSRENYFHSKIHNLDGDVESLMNLCEEISTLRDHLSNRKELSELYEKIAQLESENENLRMLNSEKFKTGLAASGVHATMYYSGECTPNDDAVAAQHPFKF